MRRPLWAAAPIVIGLLVMAVPLLDARFGLPDDRALPASVSQARRVADVVRERYQAREADAVTIALTGLDRDETATPGGAVARYAAELSRLPHVDRIDSAAGTFRAGAPIAPGRADLARGDAAAVLVLPTTEPYAEATQDLVRDVRAHSAPASVLVGGPTARYLDVNTAITTRLPLVGALIIVSTFVLLFLFTGSFVLPIKALAVNMLTIGAVSGAMVWIFQQGHGAEFLDVTPTPLSVSVPPLMFALSFGLSMDYEVFLLGRIAELHRCGVPTREAVVGGVARTGRIVTAAAALMSVTFLAFATAKVAFLQMLGLGCAVAVLLDATAVRGVLVPAMMRLLGAANWWAPGWARRLHARVGLAEGEAVAAYAPSSYAAAPAPRSHVAAP